MARLVNKVLNRGERYEGDRYLMTSRGGYQEDPRVKYGEHPSYYDNYDHYDRYAPSEVRYVTRGVGEYHHDRGHFYHDGDRPRQHYEHRDYDGYGYGAPGYGAPAYGANYSRGPSYTRVEHDGVHHHHHHHHHHDSRPRDPLDDYAHHPHY
eukprot:TRINITY_DN714_c0_g2_i1.p1 TRINITY_DN714_c0_g2~~TRINITY_DN714_c0_g2_i1.p1  ORF type:complete len:151 (+),score=28.33 TRINITY_DN714_c0_g2_i1:38-490(+)